jgi:putative endonuclease
MDLPPFIAALFYGIDRRPSPPFESTRELGRYGENVAERFLRRQGYQILCRNWRSGRWEIDLICRHRKELVFVEVKARRETRFAEPGDNVHAAKREKITRAAAAYVRQLGRTQVYARFDVVEVIVQAGRKPVCRILPNAYENARLYL